MAESGIETDTSMSSDGPTPPPCDSEVFAKGAVVCSTNGIPSNAMESWVKKVAAESGQRVDWHFARGTAIVLALGDIAKVKEAIVKLTPEHDELYLRAVEKALGKDYASRCKAPRLL